MENRFLESYECSIQQERLWNLEKELQQSFYNQFDFAIRNVSANQFISNLRQLLDQSEFFRTRLESVQDHRKPVQVITTTSLYKIKTLNVGSIKEAKDRIPVLDHGGFNKYNISIIILVVNGTELVVSLKARAIYLDIRSMQGLVNDSLLRSLNIKKLSNSQDVITFIDYSEWQHAFLEMNKEAKTRYWESFVHGGISAKDIKHFIKDLRKNTHQIKIGDDRMENLSNFSIKLKIKLEYFLLAAWMITLKKMNLAQTVHCDYSGRREKEIRNIYGPLSKYLPLSIESFDENWSFLELVDAVLKNHEENEEHFELLPLGFQLEILGFSFDYINSRADCHVQNDNITVLQIISNTDFSLLNLQVVHDNDSNELGLFFIYLSGYFSRSEVEKVANNYQEVIDFFSSNSSQKICDFQLKRLEKPSDKTGLSSYVSPLPDNGIIGVFENVASKLPQKVAIVYKHRHFTYKELNEIATGMAGYLVKEHKVQTGEIIACKLRETDQVIALYLATLKIGAVFLLLEEQTPIHRMKWILEDSRPAVLITDSIEIGLQSLVDQLNINEVNSKSNERIKLHVDVDEPAYIIYTSGTTGRPKGVPCTHRALFNYVQSFSDSYNVNEQDRGMLVSSLAFDLSYTSLWPSLLNGCTLNILSETKTLNPSQFAAALLNSPITFVKFTPSHFKILIESELFDEFVVKYQLRLIVLGGEPIVVKDIEKYFRKVPDVIFVNHYGPTETTIGVTTKLIDRKTFLRFSQQPTLGSPIRNTRIFIKDEHDNELGVGILGEICVEGVSLAKGYLNNPEETGKYFISNIEAFSYFFATGDMGMWTWDGEVQFYGRRDNQLKIHGYRVGLEEIEQVLIHSERVNKAAVIVKLNSEGDKQLIGYVEAEEGLDYDNLRADLESYIPFYMIPSEIIKVPFIPLTSNGKINRPGLTSIKGISLSQTFVLPQTKEEQLLADIWSGTLAIKKIGIKDNFFRLGGDSIKAIKISARAQGKGYSLPVGDVLKYPTIEEQVGRLNLIGDSQEDQISIQRVDALPTPIQYEFFERYDLFQESYNQSIIFRSVSGYNEQMIREVIRRILEHHDALRMSFSFENDKIKVTYQPLPKECPLKIYEYKRHCNEDEIRRHLIKLENSINITTGPLLKCAIVRCHEVDYFLLTVHHLAIDGVSWRILLDDFQLLSDQFARMKELKLPLKTSSFKLWSDRLFAYKSSHEFVNQVNYWQKYETYTEKLDFREAKLYGGKKGAMQFVMDNKQTEKLKTKATKSFRCNIQDLLVTALTLTFKKHFKNKNLILAMESHGRDNKLVDANLSRTIGCFTTIYPIRINLQYNDISRIIKEVKESIRKVPNMGIGFGLMKYPKSDSNFSFTWSSVSAIKFNYLGEFALNNSSGHFGFQNGVMFQQQPKDRNEDYSMIINGILLGDELKISVDFSTKYYNELFVQQFLQDYEGSLREVIHHCLAISKEEPSPSDFGIQLQIEHLDKILSTYDVEDIYTLSPLQEGMLFHSLYDSNSTAYLVQAEYFIEGDINSDLIEEALRILSSKHEILRTHFVSEYEQPLQIVNKQEKSKYTFLDISDLDDDERAAYLKKYKRKDIEDGFDLSEGYCYRIVLIKTHSNQYLLIWTNHHIIIDGWSRQSFISEFFLIYRNLLEGKRIQTHYTPQFKTYIKWLKDQKSIDAIKYFKDYLKDFENTSSIPKLRKSNNNESEYYPGICNVSLSEMELAKLQEFAIMNQVTLNSVIHCVWGILLGKYNESCDVVFGSVVSGRPPEIRQVEEILGLFINTQPVRVKFSPETSVNDLLATIHQSYINSEKYQYFPLPDIQGLTVSGRELIDHVIAFENYPTSIDKQVDSSNDHRQKDTFQVYGLNTYDRTSYNFNIVINVQNGLKIKVFFNQILYPEEFVESIMQNFASLLNQIVQHGLSVKDLEVKQRVEYFPAAAKLEGLIRKDTAGKHIINEYNNCKVSHGDRIALSFKDENLSYSELDNRSSIIGNQLLQMDTKKEEIVAIFSEDKIKTMESLLGVLKAGAAFVLIEPSLPASSIQWILEDTNCEIVITNTPLIDVINFYQGTILDLDSFVSDANMQHYENLQLVDFCEDDLAYVIYTSGSTGLPKGVMVEHQSVMNMILHQIEIFSVGSFDKIIQFAPLSFDASISEIFMALLSGACLHLIEKGIKQNVSLFTEEVTKRVITVMTLPPSYLKIIDESKLSCLRTLISAGEQALPRSQLKLSSKTAYFNAYGPSECAVCVTIYKFHESDYHGVYVPIGQPIPNTKVYLRTDMTWNVPEGLQSELVVSGICIARGYLNKVDLTSDKFPKEIFPKGGRLYLTGDICEIDKNHQLFYVGRKDDQVKIRGCRIELGEIESVLQGIKEIESAKVIAKPDSEGGHDIVAYYVPDRVRCDNLRRISRHQKMGLPDGVSLEKLPNGLKLFTRNNSELQSMYKEIFSDNCYIKYGIVIPPNGIVFDVGANHGLFTVYSILHSKGVQVYAFEPLPPTFELLKLNTDINPGNIKIFNYGLSNKAHRSQFTHYSFLTGLSSVYSEMVEVEEVVKKFIFNSEESNYEKLSETEVNELLKERLATEKYECDLKTLSQVMVEHNIKKIDLLKIDAEKSELDVIEGIYENDWKKIRQIVVEVHDGPDNRLSYITELLENKGYEVNIDQSADLKGTDLYLLFAKSPEVNEDSNENTKIYNVDKYYSYTSDELQNDIVNHLQRKLPDYMLPSYYVQLEEMPVASNGKVDKKTLLAFDEMELEKGIEYIAPKNETEEQLIAIFEEVLEKENIGMKDNFFDLGGHSLKAIQVVSRLHIKLKVEISLDTIFDHPVVNDLAEEIKAKLWVSREAEKQEDSKKIYI